MNAHIWMLDHLRVASAGGEPPLVVRPRAQRLLAYLLLHRQWPVARERLAFTLWPDVLEPRALATLRRALSELRAALASIDQHSEWLVVSDTSLHWNPEARYWLDIDAFTRAVQDATPSSLHQAIDLYAGDLLADWDDEWVAAERERLRQLQSTVLRRLIDHHRALGGYETALELAHRALAHDPLAEAHHRDLIALLYETGDRGAALAAYDRLGGLLDSELGVEPMAETKALRDAIVSGRPLPAGTAVDERRPVLEDAGTAAPLLVGRDAEMEALAGLWESTASGRGRLVTLSGDAGVGKTHLARALGEHVAGQGGLPLVGHCYEFEQALPYQAVVEMLRSTGTLLRHSDLPAAHRSALSRLVPDVLGVAVPADDGDDALTSDPRARLFEALWHAFLAIARGRPLLLVIEDMHWAAESTLDWLTYIAPRLESAPILIAITYRTEEIEAERPLARLIRRLTRAASIDSVILEPLSLSDHHDLVRRLSGLSTDVSEPLAERLYEETAGNPFFLNEIVHGLIETGQLLVRDGRWEGPVVEAGHDARLPLPESILGLITARVDRLAQAPRTFVQVAAVAGRVFRFDPVQRATGWEEEAALEALEDILARDFARQLDAPDDFAFAHHLIQEVIYTGMTGPRRAFWHRRLAEAILDLQPEDVESLAHHFSRAGDNERARVYFARSGDRARRFAALDDATRYYRAALDRWPESDPAGRAELLDRLGECQWVLGELRAALRTLDEARALYEQLDNQLRLGDIERATGRVYWELSDRQASLRHYHQALQILERQPEGVELARTVSALSQMHMLAGEFDDAVEWGERALDLAERLGAEDVAIHAELNVGAALASLQHNERGLAMMRSSMERAEAAGLPHDAMRACNNLGEQYFSLGRYAEAGEACDWLLTYARRVQSDFFTGIALRSFTQLHWITGRWSEALDYRRQLLDWMRFSSQPHLGTLWARKVLGMLHNDLGQPDLARQVLERDLATARNAAELQTTVPYLAELARAYTALNMDSEAAGVVRELHSWIEGDSLAVFDAVLPVLVTCRWLASHPDGPNLNALGTCLTWLEQAAREIGTPESEAALAEGRGLAFLADGAPDRAATSFQRAVDGWTTLNRPYDLVRAEGSLGFSLLLAGQTPAAGAALDRALATIDTLVARLSDPALAASFNDSPLVREIRASRASIVDLPDTGHSATLRPPA